MAPAPASRPSRSTTVPKPSKIRYFKGKAPDAAISDSDSDEDEENHAPPETVRVDKSLVAGGAGKIIPEGGVVRKIVEPRMKVALRDVKVEGGRVVLPKTAKQEEESEEESDEESEEEVKPQHVVPKAPGSEESSEYETDSEEEEKPAFRPVFVKKDARGMTQEKLAAEVEAKLKQEEEMQAQRKLDSKELAGDTIRRELAEREIKDLQPDIDDTDGIDASADFDAWRARELSRLLRDKQAQAERDEEREEIERRRALPEEQRLREDMEHADQTRAKEKGQMGFLQKYYHKGAFHQDDELLARDYTGATENAVDMSMLPKVLQVRDFGKMSRTKYTHLVDQDTSQGGWGAAARPMGQGQQGQFEQGCWNCGGPHLRKDCPNNNPTDPMGGVGGSGGTGGGYGTSANNASLGSGGPSGRWGGDKPGGQRERERGDRYREEGRERRFEETRREERDGGYDGNRGERSDRSDRGDRDGYDRRRERSRSRSPGRRGKYDRERDRDRGTGERRR